MFQTQVESPAGRRRVAGFTAKFWRQFMVYNALLVEPLFCLLDFGVFSSSVKKKTKGGSARRVGLQEYRR